MKEFFWEIAQHRRLVVKQQSLFQLFNVALEVTDTKETLATLQKEFLLTELIHSYQYFGFSLFAPSSLYLLCRGMSKMTGVSVHFIEQYLKNLKNYLYDEIRFEDKQVYFSEINLEKSFAGELVKRIFCTQKKEDIRTGMFIFDKDYLDQFRKLVLEKKIELTDEINNVHQANCLKIKTTLSEEIDEEFIRFFERLKKDPLVLIVGRLESFIQCSKNNINALFIYREDSKELQEKSQKMTAILSLLIPYKHPSGQVLSKNNMLSSQQMTKLFSTKFKSDFFNLQAIRCWLDLNETDLKNSLDLLLEDAFQYGLVFKIPVKQKDFSYGLSENGLKIMEPFHTLLKESISRDGLSCGLS